MMIAEATEGGNIPPGMDNNYHLYGIEQILKRESKMAFKLEKRKTEWCEKCVPLKEILLENLAGIDHDIQVHVGSTIVTPDDDVIRTAVCGSSYGGCLHPSMVHISPTAIAGVRCCTDLEISGWSQSSTCTVWAESIINDECLLNVTYGEAFRFCESQGARLCTENELSGDCAAGTGCELDNSMV